MNRLLYFALFSVVGMLGIAQISPPASPPVAASKAASLVEPGARYRAATAAAAAAARRSEETELQRDGSGRFRLTARVNGEDTDFLIDTGADIVALTVDEARRLGIFVDPGSFEPLVRTASGTGRGTMVELRNIEVAGREFRNVTAVVMEGLEVNLLGQSVLRRLGSLELRGDRMVIRVG